MKDQLIVMESKLGQKNQENEELQDNLKTALIRLEELQRLAGDYEDDKKKLLQQIENEKMLKNVAVNKLTQVMLQRGPNSGNSKPAPRKAHEREIRKLRGELQQEMQKYKSVVDKYQKNLEEIQRQIYEETQMRVELQHQLQASESKLRQLQQGIGSGSYVTNGPSTETDGSSNVAICK
jgi:HD superfamily phosphohydrolase